MKKAVPIVMRPPPPKPVNARIKLTARMFVPRPHPRQPVANEKVETKKQTRLPKMSEKRPYNGWKAVEVIKYAVVSQLAVLAAPNSELITAYVDAVTVPLKP